MGVRLNQAQASCAYDASAFTGITFWAKGPASGDVLAVRLGLFTMDTLQVEYGGNCDIACNDHYGADLEFGPQWQQFTFTWDQLSQRTWGTDVPFDVTQLFTIEWQLLGTPAADPFDFWIDEVAFTGGGVVGTGGTGGSTGAGGAAGGG